MIDAVNQSFNVPPFWNQAPPLLFRLQAISSPNKGQRDLEKFTFYEDLFSFFTRFDTFVEYKTELQVVCIEATFIFLFYRFYER